MDNGSQKFAGRYELLEQLGKGGFSVVHLARDVRNGMVVALKILTRGRDGEYPSDVVARFEREISLVARLRHPNTVRMLDYGQDEDGTLFMVSEYLPGEDLFQTLRREGTLPPNVVFHILNQLLGSLAEAHSQGLLHRDIKPQNIRVFEHAGDRYTVKLLDFGIARAMNQTGDDLITRDGALVGTPRYMSPEQLTDHPLGPSSDLYSLGLVAYEMLFGEQALMGSSLSEQFDRLLVDRLIAEQTVADKVGPQFERVLERMTARNPNDRFQSAESAAAALRNPGYTAPRTRDMTLMPQPRPEEPHSTVYVVGGAALLAVFAALATFLVFRLADKSEETTVVSPARENLNALLSSTPPPPEPEPVEVVDMGVDMAGVYIDFGPHTCMKSVAFRGFGSVGSAQLGFQWLTYVPESYNGRAPMPLIFLFHPDGRDGTRIIEQTKFVEIAEREGVILVAPNYWNEAESFLNTVTWRAPTDPEVLEEVLRATEEQLCVDPDRVFAIGHGSGSHLAHRLACAPWIAAVASNGYRPSSYEQFCDAKDAKPAIVFTPLNSKRMLVEGGKKCMIAHNPISLADHEELWKKRNRCSSKHSEWDDAPHGECLAFEDCKEPFISCRVEGGYGWPGSPGFREHDLTGSCNDETIDFPATELIWKFFQETTAP